MENQPIQHHPHHPLDNIEDADEFYAAIDRANLTHQISEDRPYVYWTIELYDQQNGIRGGGGLGILAADTRRTAEHLDIPFTLVTPFYAWEPHQKMQDLEQSEYHVSIGYKDHGFRLVDTIHIKTSTTTIQLEVIEKVMGSTRILAITEPNFGELYSGESGGDHRLYQEVALGFGGYQALKLVGLKPAIIQLNEVATFFAALARLDELVSSGMDFYEAVVYVRKHTLYTNHTLVQAAEAEFSYAQFETFVFPNIKSPAVRRWLADKFNAGHIKLSAVTIEIAELRSGVSKLHARVANYHDLSGTKIKFKAITNGIDIDRWVSPEIVAYYREHDILDKFNLPRENYAAQIAQISAAKIREFKRSGRSELYKVLSRADEPCSHEFVRGDEALSQKDKVLQEHPDQYGATISIPEDALLVEFKRRFVDYKRPWLPFTDPTKLADLLQQHNAHYILSGRVHIGDRTMSAHLDKLLHTIDQNPILKQRVHYLPDYDEALGQALSMAANVSINNPIVGLEACGTSWMKDMANFTLLISTHDGGVADMPADNYLSITGNTEPEEITSLYHLLDTALSAWSSDFDLEYWVHKQLTAYLPTISSTRMLRDYLDYLFPK